MDGLDEVEAELVVDLGVDGVTALEVALAVFHVALVREKGEEISETFFSLGVGITVWVWAMGSLGYDLR